MGSTVMMAMVAASATFAMGGSAWADGCTGECGRGGERAEIRLQRLDGAEVRPRVKVLRGDGPGMRERLDEVLRELGVSGTDDGEKRVIVRRFGGEGGHGAMLRRIGPEELGQKEGRAVEGGEIRREVRGKVVIRGADGEVREFDLGDMGVDGGGPRGRVELRGLGGLGGRGIVVGPDGEVREFELGVDGWRGDRGDGARRELRRKGPGGAGMDGVRIERQGRRIIIELPEAEEGLGEGRGEGRGGGRGDGWRGRRSENIGPGGVGAELREGRPARPPVRVEPAVEGALMDRAV